MASAASNHVFFDATGRRARLLTRIVLGVSTTLVFLFSVGLWSVARTPPLAQGVTLRPTGNAPAERLISFDQGGTPGGPTGDVHAFYLSEHEESLLSLRHHLNQIGTVVPDWLRVDPTSGAVKNIQTEQEAASFNTFLQRRPSLKILPSITLDGPPNTWTRSLKEAVEYLPRLHSSSLMIDLPDVHTRLAEQIDEVVNIYHAQKVQWYAKVNDPTSITPAEQRRFQRIYVSLYDEHWSGSVAGPVASDAWVAGTQKMVAASGWASKAIPVFGSLGYAWPKNGHTAEVIGFTDLAIKSRAIHQVPHFIQGKGTKLVSSEQEVWYSDAASLYNQMNIKSPVALAYLGLEDPGCWDVLAKSSPSVNISLEHNIEYQGEGEVTAVTATESKGVRSISIALDGKIRDENYIIMPSAFTLSRVGLAPKKISLTFDDGPSQAATPEILEILAAKNVQASFFMIGSSAARQPDLVKRVVAEGHLIGNHTYFHSNVSAISATQLALEINATERVFESETGKKSLLFRPPYSIDSEPINRHQLTPLATIAKAGYITVNMGIDPTDWRVGSKPEKIASSVITQALQGKGSVVLLHDGGGDRTATVRALPLIIDGLRSRGFELVGLDTLIGASTNKLMPSVNAKEVVIGKINALLIAGGNAAEVLFVGLFFGSIGLGLLRLAFIGWYAVRDRRSTLTIIPDRGYRPHITVIIPAYNEALVVLKTVESVMAQSYTNMDVVVVDDGSTDQTYDILVSSYPQIKRLCFHRIVNSGKSAAINYALSLISSEVVVIIDADTLIDPQAVVLLSGHFVDPVVAAVAGNAMVGNQLNTLTRWQALEYVMGQNLDRRAFNRLNCICVVPGAIGAWRRNVLVECGGFRSDTLAEDTDLTLELLERGWSVRYEDRAYAFTEAPDSVQTFLKQRFRWVYGTLQAMYKRRHVVLRRRHGNLGMVALPNMLVFQMLLPLLGPVMDLMMLVSIALTYWQRAQHPESYSAESVQKIFYYYLFFLGLEMATGILALSLERKRRWSLLLWLPVQRFFYRQVLYTAVIRSVVSALSGRAVGWNKLQRKATATAPLG